VQKRKTPESSSVSAMVRVQTGEQNKGDTTKNGRKKKGGGKPEASARGKKKPAIFG